MKVLGGGDVHEYSAVDEGPHRPGPQPLWQESVVLVWWDLKNAVGGFYRIGHEYNVSEGTMISLWSNVVTPAGVYKKTTYLPFRAEDKIENGFASGNDTLKFEYKDACIWSLKDEGISSELRVHDFHPSIDCYPKKGAISEFAPHHMEVAGRVTGTLDVHGTHYDIDALCFRDHGWGVRAWDSLLSHRWLSGVFSKELSFCGLSWHTTDDNMAQFGWVVKNDTVTFAKKIDIVAYVECDAMTTRGGHMTMTLTTGEVLEIEYEAVAPSLVSFHHGIACVDTLCKITCGDHVGIGDFESTSNGQQGKRKPQRLSRGVIENGWHATSEPAA